MNLQTSSQRLLVAVLAFALLLAASWASPGRVEASFPQPGESASAPVGKVSIVLGEAWLYSGSDRDRIRRDMNIRASDEVRTASNGHVHIQFIDEALVAVRPDSHLQITRYDYNAENPAQSTIKFNLVEGVTRSISGKGAHAAQDRYRMNTPIAAIGVRGTDFVVSASRETVRAQVNEGAIVVAPFSNDCLAASIGPCSLNATELTDSSGQILELGEGQDLPRLLPLPDTRIPELMRERRDRNQGQRQQVATAPGDQSEPEAERTEGGVASSGDAEADVAAIDPVETETSSSESNDLYRESVSFRNAEQITSTSSEAGGRDEDASVDPVDPVDPANPADGPDIVDNPDQPEPPVEPEIPAVPEAPDFTPAVQVAAARLEERQLVWGRWSGGKGAAERITTTYAAASAEPREIAVGNRGYQLFRTEEGPKSVAYGLGAVSFDLDAAQAFFHPEAGGAEAMRVGEGSLDIDFNSGEFATELLMDHQATGAVDFSATGRIDDAGYFHSRDDLQDMAGAVSLDGAEAGYFFEKQIGSGTVEGLTLWGRQ